MSSKILANVAAVFSVAALLAAPTAEAAPANHAVQAGQPAAGRAHGPWSAVWATATYHPFERDFFGPNWSEEGFSRQSVRQVIRVSTGGALVRLRLTNRHGTGPLRVTGATVAKTATGAAIRVGTVRTLRFHGRPATTIAAGGATASDPVLLPVQPLEKLTVTLYFAGATGPATFHEAAFGTASYRASGNHLYDAGADAYAGENSHSWYFLSGVDVAGAARPAGTVVAFGDSLTDGSITTPDAANTYPDELAERLVAAGVRRGVVNAGINGNKVLSDSTCFGERATARFERDALGQPRVRAVIVLEGINDIGSAGADFGCGPSPAITAAQLIDGHRKLIQAAHRRGVTIVGCTLPPFKGADFYYNERTEAMRDALNQWIRTSGEYDAVVDLDRILADPADPERMNPAYDAGDHLHPNDAGMKAIAAAIPLGSL